MFLEVGRLLAVPLARVAALARCRAFEVKPCLALGVCPRLALTANAGRNGVAARAEARRFDRHYSTGLTFGRQTATTPSAMLVPPAFVTTTRA